MSKTIFILGGGTMQMPSIRIAKRKGWRVIVADGNPKAEGRDIADHFAHVDLKDMEGIEKVAKYYKNLFGIDGIFTTGTDFSKTVSYVAGKLDLPGIPFFSACNSTNKYMMRQVFVNNNIPCPKYTLIKEKDDPVKALKKLKLPLVVKPTHNMGARGVRKIDSEEELYESVKLARYYSHSRSVIIEEFMSGVELSLDAIVYNENIMICGIADRIICFPPYFVEMGHTIPSKLPEKVLKKTVSVFKKGIEALGIKQGAAKGDIIITDAGPKVGEIAARLSGGYMSGWTYPFSSGIEVTDAALQIAVGFPPGDLTPRENNVSAERAFISIPGRVKKILGFEKIRKYKNIMASFLRIKEGQNVVFPRNNVEKCGNVISKAISRIEAINCAENAIRDIIILLEPDNTNTENFLLSKDSSSYYNNISAFTIELPRNIEFFHNMEEYRGNLEIKNIKDISILELPSIKEEKNTDWHGQTLKQALDKLIQISNITVKKKYIDNNKLYLGKIFWRVFLKAGVQGGMYILDSLNKALMFNIPLVCRLKKWIQD